MQTPQPRKNWIENDGFDRKSPDGKRDQTRFTNCKNSISNSFQQENRATRKSSTNPFYLYFQSYLVTFLTFCSISSSSIQSDLGEVSSIAVFRRIDNSPISLCVSSQISLCTVSEPDPGIKTPRPALSVTQRGPVCLYDSRYHNAKSIFAWGSGFGWGFGLDRCRDQFFGFIVINHLRNQCSVFHHDDLVLRFLDHDIGDEMQSISFGHFLNRLDFCPFSFNVFKTGAGHSSTAISPLSICRIFSSNVPFSATATS